MAGKLADNKEVAYLSYQLATIKTDVELELTCDQLEVQEPAAEELLGLFRKYEFKRWTTDVEAGKWLQAKGQSCGEAERNYCCRCRRAGRRRSGSALIR